LRQKQSEVEEHRIGELDYLLQYKKIRRMYLRLRMPDSKVLVSVPFATPLPEVERFVAGNLGWIARQRKKQEERRCRRPVCHYETGDIIYVWGQAYELLVLTDMDMVKQMCGEEAAEALQRHAMASVKMENSKILLACPESYDSLRREHCLDLWLKRQLEAFLPAIFQGCGTVVGKRESSWYVRKMKTRWGTCNIKTGRVCINLTLGHLPPQFLSYIVTHELTHLWEKGHGEGFKARMDIYYPQWRERRKEMETLTYMI